ncbi:MAG: hypothetical protein K2Q09_02890, partial [Phycisphaerales bacterium]|nr:hypothetical protein [Phycisphaerales bacterium]
LLAADVQATLTVPALTALASAGAPLSGNILLRNTGNAAATGFTYRVFLSPDSGLGNEDDVELTGVDGLTATLAAGATSTVNLNTFTVPTDLRPGAYFLMVQLDTTNAVTEGDAGEANNTVSTTAPVITLNGPAANSANLSATLTFAARTVGPDQQIAIPTVIRNTGTATATNFRVTWVLSTNEIIGDADDIAIDEEAIGSLAPGATTTISRNIQLPVGLALGNYRVGVWVDDRGDIAESNEADNRAVSAANALNVALPDLTATFTSAGGSVAPGSFFTGTLTVRNLTQAASSGFFVTISLSTDGTAGNSDDIELMMVRIEDLADMTVGVAGNGTRTIAGLRVYIPYGTPAGDSLNPGAYRIVVRVDTNAEVAESNETNNSTITATNVVTIPARDTANDPAGPDLFAYAYPISGTVYPGQVVNVAAILGNLGNADSGPVIFSAYLSSNNTFDGGDILLSSDFFGEITEFLPGSYYGVARLTVPGNAPNGSFFVIFVADPANSVVETNENNNHAAAGTATVARSTVSVTAPDSS